MVYCLLDDKDAQNNWSKVQSNLFGYRVLHLLDTVLSHDQDSIYKIFSEKNLFTYD